MKILTVVDAHPQFIKVAVASRAFAEHRPEVRKILVHTVQHYDTDMSDMFFDELNISCSDHTTGVGWRYTRAKQWLHAGKANGGLNARMVLAYVDNVSMLTGVKCSVVLLSN